MGVRIAVDLSPLSLWPGTFDGHFQREDEYGGDHDTDHEFYEQGSCARGDERVQDDQSRQPKPGIGRMGENRRCPPQSRAAFGQADFMGKLAVEGAYFFEVHVFWGGII